VENADDSDEETQRRHVEVERISPVPVKSLYLKQSERDQNPIGGRINRSPNEGPSLALGEPIVIGIHAVHGQKYTPAGIMDR